MPVHNFVCLWCILLRNAAVQHPGKFARSCVGNAAAILHRRALQRSAGDAETLARDNRARTALLSAVSHDLRTPLASIKAAVGSLRSNEVTFTAEDQAELEAIIEESADRLEALMRFFQTHPCPHFVPFQVYRHAATLPGFPQPSVPGPIRIC